VIKTAVNEVKKPWSEYRPHEEEKKPWSEYRPHEEAEARGIRESVPDRRQDP